MVVTNAKMERLALWQYRTLSNFHDIEYQDYLKDYYSHRTTICDIGAATSLQKDLFYSIVTPDQRQNETFIPYGTNGILYETTYNKETTSIETAKVEEILIVFEEHLRPISG